MHYIICRLLQQCGRFVCVNQCQSVSLLVTFVGPAKMAEPIEMTFRGSTRVGPRNHVLDRVQITKRNGKFWGLSGTSKKHGDSKFNGTASISMWTDLNHLYIICCVAQGSAF